MLCIGSMHQFQKSRVHLLTELQELVTRNLSEAHEYVTRDVRRYNRKLKALRRTLKEWAAEIVVEEKLKKQSAAYMEEQRKKTEEYYASDPSNRDQ